MLDTQQLKKIYNNEQILLLLFSRLYFSSCQKTEVETFIASQSINWRLMLEIARVHSIRAFIYHIITVNKIIVDTGFELSLKKKYYNTRMKNLGQLYVTKNLVAELKKCDISIIPYKGAIFAQSYYADVSLRESIDIDFLVSQDDVKAIEDFLIKENYNPITTVPRSYLPYYRTFFKDIVYNKQENVNASIEMHWRLMDRFSGDYPSYDFFSPHLVLYQAQGMSIQKLAPSYDFLAVVSNHLVKDMGIKFKYLIDLACIIIKERESLDTTVIFNCAKRYGFEKKLSVGLDLVTLLLGITLIERAETITLPEELLKTPLEYPIHLPRLYINEVRFIKRSLQLQDNLWQQMKFLTRCTLYVFLPTYADINELKLPVYFLPVLIVIRPFRLLYQAIKSKKNTA